MRRLFVAVAPFWAPNWAFSPASWHAAGVSPEPVRRRHFLDGACALAALAIPLVVTLLRVASTSEWRDDLAAVRGLGLVPIGSEGSLSLVLMQAASLVPIGGKLLRAGVVSALGLAVASRLVFQLARRALELAADTPRLTPPLALAAALGTTLASTWQLEGTLAGGVTLAAAIGLAALCLRPRPSERDARVWLGYGALCAAGALESHAAGIATLVAVVVQMLAVAELPPRRSIALGALGALGAGTLCLAPWAAAALRTGTGTVDLARDLAALPVVSDTAAERVGALGAWLSDLGIVSLALALGGAAWGLTRAATRWLVAPLAVLVVLDVVWPASRGGMLAADPLAALRLLAVAALSVTGVLGVQVASVALSTARIPFARQASTLLVAFEFTLVLMCAEDASFTADRAAQRGAETFTDEALGALPRGALVLVDDPAVAWRLWAARVVRGDRPDVVVVPLGLVDRASVARRLLALEPALAGLVRDVAITGRPSELSLSSLADLRPLRVDGATRWSRRLQDHLLPAPLWLGCEAHALGRSDRTAALPGARAAFDRVLTAAATPEYRDRATLELLASRVRVQAQALALLDDKASVALLVADLKKIDPEHRFLRDLADRPTRDHVASR